jgi:hypothetical protein
MPTSKCDLPAINMHQASSLASSGRACLILISTVSSPPL